jgi:hypothetical protein
MATLGEVLAAARRFSVDFEHWLAAREPATARELLATVRDEGGSMAGFGRFASEEDWVQLTSRFQDSEEPGIACLLVMVTWRMEQTRTHESHARQGAVP